MKIVVIGGTGLIGSKLTKKLRDLEHEVIPASPSKGIDAVTGKGLADALQNADVVVDVSNSPSFEEQAALHFFEESGRHLIAAEKAAGVSYHIALSVVGTDLLLESGYFRAKMAQEKLIIASGIPYTIVRATQFFEFLSSIAEVSTKGQTVHFPPALLQPIAADDVTAALLGVVLENPRNDIVEIAGPDRFLLSEIVEEYLKATNDPRKVIEDEQGLYYGIKISRNALIPSKNPRLGSINFQRWLESQKKVLIS